jgi:hypothetical protein
MRRIVAIAFGLGAVGLPASGATNLSFSNWEYRKAESSFTCLLNSSTGATCLVEVSENLINWTTFGLLEIPATGGSALLKDTNAANLDHRFYRASSGTNRSANAVGYVRRRFNGGFTQMANPLNNPPNRSDHILPEPPDNTIAFIWPSSAYTIFTFVDGIGWDPSGFWQYPGSGTFIQSPFSGFTSVFVGEVPQGRLTNALTMGGLTMGWNMLGSMVPQAGRLTTDLSFPASDGDAFYRYHNENGRRGYEIATFETAIGWDPVEPSLSIGDSFWLQCTTAKLWIREFSVWDH